MTEINFLCVHKKFRTKRMAPILIKEVTRRVNSRGVFQAIYTSGSLFPCPFAECRYWHRNINVKKLIDCSFSYLPEGRSMGLHKKYLKIPKEPTLAGVRQMEKKDAKDVHNLLTEYMKKMDVSFIYNKAEVAHQLLPREGVMSSWVVEDSEGKVTDFISYYALPSTILKSQKEDDKINACFSFYNVATSCTFTELIHNATILA